MLDVSPVFCLVTHCVDEDIPSYLEFVEACIAGGVNLVQLRHKSSESFAYQLGQQLRKRLRQLKVPLIVNDSIELAQVLDADGVHLGQSDLSPEVARAMLGNHKIIGLSIENMQQLFQANSLDCIDYVGASAIFKSSTKLDCQHYWGLQGLESLVQHSKHPVVAIGGITAETIPGIMERGAAGVALVAALHEALDVQGLARNMWNLISADCTETVEL